MSLRRKLTYISLIHLLFTFVNPAKLDLQQECGIAKTFPIEDSYLLHNNVWGWQSDGAGTQCVWYDSSNGKWGVNASHTDGTAQDIKGYPSIVAGWLWYNEWGSIWARPEDKTFPVQINNIRSLTTTWDVTVPSNEEIYNTAYDIWIDEQSSPNYQAHYEIMVWLNARGQAYNGGDFGPLGDQVGSNVNIAGHPWNIYKGWNGINTVYSFRRASDTYSVTNLNLLELLNYAVSAGIIQSWNYLLGIQAGWEVVAGGSWTTNKFSVALEKFD